MAEVRQVIRTKDAGVFYGEVVSKEYTQAGIVVKVKDARRVYYWEGAASLSELAMHGVTKPKQCKFPCTVDLVELIQIEAIPLTEKAGKILDSVTEWKMRAD